jgi:hypothetical protein
MHMRVLCRPIVFLRFLCSILILLIKLFVVAFVVAYLTVTRNMLFYWGGGKGEREAAGT